MPGRQTRTLTGEPISIRRAGPGDAGGIARVLVAAWRAAYRGLLSDEVLDRLSVEDAERRWGERIARPWGHILVAEQAARLVGFAACGESQDEDVDRERVGEIYVLYVHPEVWRRGVGTALLREALARLRADGFRVLIGGAGKRLQVTPQRTQIDHFIHEPVLGAIGGP